MCNRAYERYKAAFAAGDDGRPDWFARKSCNYMTEAVEDCGSSLVGACYEEAAVAELKAAQLRRVLVVMETTVEEWDTEKCPAVR